MHIRHGSKGHIFAYRIRLEWFTERGYDFVDPRDDILRKRGKKLAGRQADARNNLNQRRRVPPVLTEVVDARVFECFLCDGKGYYRDPPHEDISGEPDFVRCEGCKGTGQMRRGQRFSFP